MTSPSFWKTTESLIHLLNTAQSSKIDNLTIGSNLEITTNNLEGFKVIEATAGSLEVSLPIVDVPVGKTAIIYNNGLTSFDVTNGTNAQTVAGGEAYQFINVDGDEYLIVTLGTVATLAGA